MMKNFILSLLAGFAVLAGAQVTTVSQQSISNLVPNGGAEQAVARWGRFQTTLTNGVPSTAPAICSTCSITFGVTTVSPLSGKSSFTVSSSAATTPGHGFITNAFNLPVAAQGQVLTLRSLYSVTTGLANVNLSGTTSNSWATYIYELPSGTWTQPTGAFGMSAVSGLTTPATFQPQSGTTSIRIAVVAVNATAGAHTILWDDFFLGTQSQSAGVAVADFKSAGTLTIGAITTAPTKGTVVNDSIGFSRSGDTARIIGAYKQSAASGSAGSGDYLFSLPAGLQFDPAKVAYFNIANIGGNTNPQQPPMILGSAQVGAANTLCNGQIIPYDATRFRIMCGQVYANGTNNNLGVIGSAYFPTTNTALNYSFDFQAPILGWSTNVSQSSDYDGRQIVTKLSFSAAQGNNATAGNTIIPFNSVEFDTAGSAVGNGQIKVPASGLYEISLHGVANVGQTGNVYIWKNGVQLLQFLTYTTDNWVRSNSTILPAVTNDVFDLRCDGNCGWYVTTKFQVKRLNGTGAIQQAPAVQAIYYLGANQSVSANTVVKYDTKVVDTHNAYNPLTGQFTCPLPGLYKITAGGGGTVTSGLYCKYDNNTVACGALGMVTANTPPQSQSKSWRCLQGKTFQVNFEGTGTLLGPSGLYGPITDMQIERTGN